MTLSCLAALLAAPLAADTVQLTAVLDNTLYESATGALSNGAGSRIFSGNTNQAEDFNARRALVRFDLAGAIPAGSTISSATLTLYVSRVNTDTQPRAVELHRLLASWGEGSSNANAHEGDGAPATPNDATWIHRFYPSLFWTDPGGDFAATASATTSVGAGIGFASWSSAGLAADVQGWLAQPGSNFGWAVIGDESTSPTARRFESRETTNATERPKLLVVFTPPAAVGACCANDGACTLLAPLACLDQNGSYLGNGTSCNPNPCPQPVGACCLGNGSCASLTAAGCAAAGGAWHGAGSLCADVFCPVVTGACCLPGNPGSCEEHTAKDCASAGGGYLGDASACGVDLCPFVDPLPLPAVAIPVSGEPGGAASYVMPITEEEQRLHRDLAGETRVWTYGGTYPGPTIEAGAGQPIAVTWWNDLRDESNQPRTTHLLPVDSCLHGGETAAARVVTHVHGAHVPAASDGYPEATLLPGESAVYNYPNLQLPATIWYHDHALGITRLNVYLGLAGFYLIRDPFELALALPEGPYEIALAVQDRSFLPDGSLDYPATWEEHFFGDTILVNGKVWPYLEVRRGKYRFRLLNGCNARTLRLALSNGAAFHQIGTDGGLLPAPVALTSLTIAPGERADLVVDFAPYAAGTVLKLVNDAPAPFPGTPGVGVVADVLEFRIQPAGGDTAPLPVSLRPLIPLDEADATVARSFELRKFSEACAGSMWMINGLEWDDVTERPFLGDTEVWSFVNRSGVVHPMHLHLEMFQILDRQPFEVVDGEIVPTGPRVPPAANEAGWKDTVAVNPFEIARVIVKFQDYAGLYPYHCHILEHEDHEMMRQFETRPRALFADGFESGTPCAWSASIGGAGCP